MFREIQVKEINIRKAFMYINMLCLFIFSVQLFQAPDIKSLIWVLVMWFYIVITTRENILDIKAVLLLVGMCLHAWMFGRYNDQFTNGELIELAVIPFLAYIGGKLLVAFQNKDNFARNVRGLVLITGFGITIHATLNYMNYLESGFVIEAGKRWLDYWTQIPLYATEHSFYGAMMGGLLFYACH